VPSSLKLDPGATGTTTLQVTSPAGTPAGLYPVTVTAVKWPNYIFNASTSVKYEVSNDPVPDFAITAPSSVTIQQGSSAPVAVGSTVSNGFSADVSLSISGLPAGVTDSFNPATLRAPGSGTSTLTLSVNSAAVAGKYAIAVTGTGGGSTHAATISLTVSSTPPPPPPPPASGSYTLFSGSTLPAVPNAYAGSPLELGMKLTSDLGGYITGVRFYKGSSNTGTHVGSLWTRAGQLLAQATFVNETSAGWQQVNFSSPVAISANTIYLVSYHSSGYYSYDAAFFNSPVDNPPLHAVPNSTSSNGVYSFGATTTFPTSSAGGSNFWVDAIFSAASGTASLLSITVTPSTSLIAVGTTQAFHAMGNYSDSTTQDLTEKVSWDSATKTVATITGAGVATAVGVGSSQITASLGGIVGQATLQASITAPPPPPSAAFTLFSNTAVPTVSDSNAGAPLELGMKFTSDVAGHVSGVRFYKGTSNVGTHIGSLWTSTGQLLSQVTFVGETPSGWQQADFSAPVAIIPNTVYVCPTTAPASTATNSSSFNSAVDNPPLHAVRNTVSGNGVYAFGANSIFPAIGAGGGNFWVDAVFSTGAGTATLVSISVTPPAATIATGTTQSFHAVGTYSDSSTQDISGQVSWDSANKTVATIDAGGLATAVGTGSSTITAARGSISGSAVLTVGSSPPPPANLYTLFGATAVPAVVDANAGSSIEMGMLFMADRNGTITGVRFYKSAANLGPHVGTLWSSSGQMLAQAIFSNETASEWQQANFASPVPISTNTVYVISYHSSGRFSYNLGFFNTAVDNPPLHAPRNGIRANGVYSFGANPVFPATGAAGQNFWVDVVFQP